MPNPSFTPATIHVDHQSLQCEGAWTLEGIVTLQKQWKKLAASISNATRIDGSQISTMDSAGAWLLAEIAAAVSVQAAPPYENFRTEHSNLLQLARSKLSEVTQARRVPAQLNWLSQVGQESINKSSELLLFLEFIGETAMTALHALKQPARLPFAGLAREMEAAGIRALPILALLSFLVGVVLAYQMGLQLKNYGANIFIVNLSGMAVFREFGPLITAIIIAGRTGSSFTAEIGLMMINQEIDALRTLGISPIARLVLPKLFGLIIVLPLLTVWADIFGVFGSMVMSQHMLGIHFSDFLSRFHQTIALSDYGTGLSKAPVFAAIIAMVGCFQGLQVSSTAESVGRLTTKSVVQAIFLIIIADAGFSVLFSWMGI